MYAKWCKTNFICNRATKYSNEETVSIRLPTAFRLVDGSLFPLLSRLYFWSVVQHSTTKDDGLVDNGFSWFVAFNFQGTCKMMQWLNERKRLTSPSLRFNWPFFLFSCQWPATIYHCLCTFVFPRSVVGCTYIACSSVLSLVNDTTVIITDSLNTLWYCCGLSFSGISSFQVFQHLIWSLHIPTNYHD